MPDLVDIKLLLASRAFDDDWLMRPRLQLQVLSLLAFLVQKYNY